MKPILLTLAASVAVVMVAEARDTGDIRGTIEDTDGLPVADAKVVLTGDGFAGEISEITDANGTFDFDGLPSGDYTIVVYWDDAPMVQADVAIDINRTTSVPLTIDLSADVEEIEVVSYAPVIDTTSSALDAAISDDAMQNLPVGRSFIDVVSTLPGVSSRTDTGGTTSPSVRGEGAYGNNYFIDGVSVRDPATKTSGQDVNFDVIKEIQVYTDGAPAEFGQFTGMAVNVVTKDGGNEHHGSASVYYSQHAWINSEYDILNPNTGKEEPTTKRKFRTPTVFGTFGGPIVKDKLWYQGAVDFGYSTSVPEGADADFPRQSYTGSAFFKLTAFANDKTTIRLVFNDQFGQSVNNNASVLVDPAAYENLNSNTFNSLLTVTWRPDYSAELVTRAGVLYSTLNAVPASGDELTPARTDGDGIARDNAQNYDYNKRMRAGGGLTFTKIWEEAAGRHKFKTGAEYWFLRDSRELVNTGRTEQEWINADGELQPGDVRDLGTRYSGTPDYPCQDSTNYSDCQFREHWTNAGALGNSVHTVFFFIQDDWSPVRNFTLNLGFRMDVERGLNDEGNPPETKDLDQLIDGTPLADIESGKLNAMYMPAPRVGFAWDITNDGKTKLAAHYGWYYDIAGSSLWSWANARSANGFMRFQNANAPGEDPDWQWTNTQDPEGHPLIYAKGLIPARMEKVVVSFERELVPFFALGVRGIWSQSKNIPEDVDVNFDDWFIMNSPLKSRNYRAVEFTVEKRFNDNWQLFGSYTLSESIGHMPGQFETESGGSSGSNGNGVGVYLDDVGEQATRQEFFDGGLGIYMDYLSGLGRYSVSDPDFNDDAGYWGYLPYHSFHNVKLNFSYTFDFGTTLGAVYEFDSGSAWQKNTIVEFYGFNGMGQGRGSRFMPAANYLDLRLAQAIYFQKERQLEITFDVFNVLGLKAPTTYFRNDTAAFGATTSRQAPPSFRAGLIFRY